MMKPKTRLRPRYYKGNPNLKGAGVEVQMTVAQRKEFMRCATDPVYFGERYVKIVNVDKGLMLIKMYDFQKEFVRAFHKERFVIGKVGRQAGKTTSFVVYCLWYIIFHKNVSVAILANKAPTARDILGRIKLAYEYLPQWMQHGVVKWDMGSIQLDTGSKVMAGSTSSSAIRGTAQNLVYLDEFAFVPNNLAEEFFRSVYPVIASGRTTKTFIISTPKGMNHYYKMWVRAKSGENEYKAIEVAWNDIPGRDEEWKRETIANIGQSAWDQEFECQFLGSAHTLIDPKTLARMVTHKPVLQENDIRYFETPVKEGVYIAVVDPAEGLGADYSTMTFFRVDVFPYKQVATFRSNTISYLMLPYFIEKHAKLYNNAFVLVETNNIGQEVANVLYSDYEYENVITFSTTKRSGVGVRTDKRVKRIGCSNLKTLLESDKLIINDINTYEELTTFIRKGNSFEADAGANDDLVSNLWLFSWFTTHDLFSEIADSNLRQKFAAQRMKELEDDVLPMGFIVDGTEEENFF